MKNRVKVINFWCKYFGWHSWIHYAFDPVRWCQGCEAWARLEDDGKLKMIKDRHGNTV
jgi:hypothetical protein